MMSAEGAGIPSIARPGFVGGEIHLQSYAPLSGSGSICVSYIGGVDSLFAIILPVKNDIDM